MDCSEEAEQRLNVWTKLSVIRRTRSKQYRDRNTLAEHQKHKQNVGSKQWIRIACLLTIKRFFSLHV